MKNLVEEVALLEKKWEVPHLLDELPEFFSAAATNAAQFGKVSSKNVMDTTKSMASLAASYR